MFSFHYQVYIFYHRSKIKKSCLSYTFLVHYFYLLSFSFQATEFSHSRPSSFMNKYIFYFSSTNSAIGTPFVPSSIFSDNILNIHFSQTFFGQPNVFLSIFFCLHKQHCFQSHKLKYLCQQTIAYLYHYTYF